MINFKWEGRCMVNLRKDLLFMRRFEGCRDILKFDLS